MMTESDKIAGYMDVVTGSREAPIAGGAAHVPAASAPELRSLLAIAVGTLAVAALYFAQDVLIPIMLAVMLSFVLSPVVALLQRLRLWRAPAVIIAVLAALGLLGAVGTLISSQAAALSTNAPQYARTIEAKVQGIQAFAVGRLASITQSLGGSHSQRRASTAAVPTVGVDATSARPVPAGLTRRRRSLALNS